MSAKQNRLEMLCDTLGRVADAAALGALVVGVLLMVVWFVYFFSFLWLPVH